MDKDQSSFGSDKWLLAHQDNFAGINSFSACIALADLHGDGESKLIVADLGTAGGNMKLKVFITFLKPFSYSKIVFL